MLATRLAARLGLCVPQIETVDVRPDLIAHTSEMVMQFGSGRMPCSAGKQLGSQFPGYPARTSVHDFLLDEQLSSVQNLEDFLGIYVFDKWTCNTDRRQVVFFHAKEGQERNSSRISRQRQYLAMMIDQGACFNGGEWNFPDAPLRGIYENTRVYENVAGIDAFEPWIELLEKGITEDVLKSEAQRIPSEWYADVQVDLQRLLDRLYDRRARVRELIESAQKSNRNTFPNWKVRFYPAVTAHAGGARCGPFRESSS